MRWPPTGKPSRIFLRLPRAVLASSSQVWWKGANFRCYGIRVGWVRVYRESDRIVSEFASNRVQVIPIVIRCRDRRRVCPTRSWLHGIRPRPKTPKEYQTHCAFQTLSQASKDSSVCVCVCFARTWEHRGKESANNIIHIYIYKYMCVCLHE